MEIDFKRPDPMDLCRETTVGRSIKFDPLKALQQRVFSNLEKSIIALYNYFFCSQVSLSHQNVIL